jgi:hypothetical protein
VEPLACKGRSGKVKLVNRVAINSPRILELGDIELRRLFIDYGLSAVSSAEHHNHCSWTISS